MKKHILLVPLCLLSLTACEIRKSYKYVEIIEDDGIISGVTTKEKEAKIITAATDSAAYLEAFKAFTISVKVNNDMKASMKHVYSKPVKFKLLNSNNVDVANSVFFDRKLEMEEKIEKEIFAMENLVQIESGRSTSKNDTKKQPLDKDSLKIKKLLPFFEVNSDEFSNTDTKWYKPKGSPKYVNANGIYCYFQTESEKPNNFRLRIQYYSDDWLFFEAVQFSIDGKAYQYTPLRTETDSGNGGHIWEWLDEQVTQTDKELIMALSNAKTAKMKLVGRQYHKIKEISPTQINSIRQTVELYIAMGGQW